MIHAEIIADSIGPNSPRLTTMRCVYPKFVHNEHLRHRAFSFSVSSARAIPFNKLLEEVRDDNLRGEPVFWGSEQKGMSTGSQIENIKWAKLIWRTAAVNACREAEELAKSGLHKSICNRIIEPFIHCHVLVTGTEAGWMNYFGLRLDSAAEPTIRALAELQWKHYSEHQPIKLEPDQWHLPFIDDETWDTIGNKKDAYDFEIKQAIGVPIRISVARCARLSYNSFETSRRSTIEEDLKLYDRLVGSSPIHASPAEHQAMPDILVARNHELKRTGKPTIKLGDIWENPNSGGNFGPGWIQYRKILPGENLAPLPKEYIR